MHICTKSSYLKLGILGAGLLGALLRMLLYITGTDEKGLLVTGHWAALAVWLLTVGVLLLLILRCRSIEGPKAYKHSYPASVASAAGCILCAMGFLLTALASHDGLDTNLDIATTVLSIVSAAGLGWVGLCRLNRKKPSFICHCIVSVCFALRMVGQYRFWSADPQLQDYCFYMFAHVGLMLTSYHLSAFDAGFGSHRAVWFWGLLSTYLCLLCLYGGQDPLFMFFCGVWLLLNLPRLEAPARRVRPKLDLNNA